MVTNNFSKSSLDLNGQVSLNMPTALDWGADGRLYVTEVSGEVKILTVAFGDPAPDDGDGTASFYVTDAETLSWVKSIPNHNDDGSASSTSSREVTGIDVTPQYDENGAPVIIDGKPAVNVYVTSSDSRIGAGNGGEDTGLDTNSGIITRLTQTESGWEAVDLVRGLARSEENHALNGLEVIQELDASGHLVSERIIVANGGNANAGAPSNNFSGQQETAYSAAILEIDLDQLNAMEVKTDGGRQYIYDVPTLDDPSRAGAEDGNDPFGGNDGFNGGKIDPDGPVQIYSPGYRNAYDVEVTEDGRVWTYDNGANNSWGGRPIGEAGDNGSTKDTAQQAGYIATNLNNGDGNGSDTINLENGWNPKNYDQFHEITRSDDLAGRILSAGQGGAATYSMTHPDFAEPLTLVYGGHPNPTRASGGEAGLLFTPKDGVEDAFLLVSEDHYDAVIDWFTTVENAPGGVGAGQLTSRVIGVAPGELYYITENGNAYPVSGNPGNPSSIQGSSVLGEAGIPADFDEVVATLNPIEGNYLEGGYTDGALDSGLGSINGLTEYTSTVLDTDNVKMSGAILASQYNGGDLIVMGRDENGVMQTAGGSGATKAADRITLELTGSPLGLTSIGDDLSAWDNQSAFRGSVWASVYSGSGTKVEILQPNNGAVPLAGSEVSDSTDHDLDGVDNIHDPFEYSATNGLALTPGKAIVLDFQPTEAPYPGTLGDTGLMGAALDGSTPNQDANPDQGIPGLFDNGGNIIPGANAPIFQIKNVVPGSVVGSDNGVRDAMHVGVNPSDDVQRLVATTQVQNWIPTAGGVAEGQLTGILFGDGTQANFVRLVFGEVNGEPGFEVGYEIGDSNYQALAQVGLPALAAGGTTEIELRLEIDMANGFALHAAYRLNDQDEFTDLPLGDFTLPEGVLQDVLTGSHTIDDGDTQLSSGAAFGFLAETSEGAPLAPVNFNNLQINGFGDEIADTTPPEVVSIALDQPLDNDSPILATVVVTDNAGIDVASISGDELVFTGYTPGGVSLATGSDAIRLSDDGKTATIQYLISPPSSSNAWSSGSFEVGVAAGSYTDTAGLGVAAYETDAFIVTNLDSLVKGALQRAINVGATSDSIDNSLQGDDKHTYGGAISDDPILGIDLEADDPDYYSPGTKTGNNIDGKAGTTGSNSGGIDLDGSAYHTYRDSSSGSYTATYDVPNGVYVVELHFAELYQSQAGQRQGDYTIQGETFAENFDAFTQAGGADKPVVLTKNVVVTDGRIVIGVTADTGEPGFNAVAIYQAVAGDVPVASILAIDTPEASDGQVVVSVRYTDDDAIAQAQIDTGDVTVSSSAGGAPVSPAQATYDSASGVATYTFDAPDGGWQTGTVTATVGANAVVDGDDNGNGATSSSVYASYSSEGVILALDFETSGSPLEEGGFDGTLGNVSDDSVVTTVEGGELIVWTSNGDMSQAANPSANDFIKHVALGSASLNVINISSRFDNPFPEAFAAQGLDTSTVPNYAQQGIVFGLGTQNHNQLLKLVFGGNGGTVVQLWSRGSIDTKISLEEMLSDASKGLTDIAKVELTLSIDKAAGTVTPIATLFDANDNVLGGLRAEPTEGFATAAAEILPAAVLANLTDPDGETAVGVTSTDYGNPVGSFQASWEHLNVTSPDLPWQPDPQITLAILDAEPAVESGDDGTTSLSFGLSASEGFSGEVDLALTVNGAAETRTVNFEDGVGALTVDVGNDDRDDGPERVTVVLTGVDDPAFSIAAGSAMATGSVTEDDTDMDASTLNLEFNDGDTLETLFDGVTEGSGTTAEETGSATIADGNLIIAATDGDAGGGNNANDNYYANVAGGGGFSASLKFGNPFPTLPAQYSQLGMNVSLSQDEYLKVTFGNVGGGQQIEYSYENGGVQTKQAFGLPSGVNVAQIADVVIALDASVANEVATFSGSMTFLDASGQALGSTALPALALPDGPLNTAIVTEGATFGVGVTQTSIGSGPNFDASYDYLEITPTETDDTGTPPAAVEEIFAAANLDLGDTYGQGELGSALVTVTPGNDNVQYSNYGNDSFKVQNTGDKKIAAVFFDVTTALYGDSVFDPDGKGGDAAFKDWAINSDGNTGAIQPSGYEHYFLPGTDPDPSNPNDNGGFRGALVKFSATADGGFTNGEVVGFSGDMDPNSIAGFNKGGAAGVDTGSLPAWDVGGVSGAELIGSNVYIKFTDGSTASGQLMSDGSQAGAQVRITEAPMNLTAELSVNGVSSGGQGTYGGAVPSVIVSGPAGEWVRVVMTKGHQPVANEQNGIADTVDERLADKTFPANNAAEFQIVDVQLGASGTADVSQAFNYADFLNGTSSFGGDDTLPLGFVASVIDDPNSSQGLALGPVSRPVYLISNGSPVDGSNPANTEPFVNNAMDDQTIQFEDGFVFKIPDDVFVDLDGDELSYEALNLPAGVLFDAQTKTFSGVPTSGEGTYSLQVQVVDKEGASATTGFDLVVLPEEQGEFDDLFIAAVEQASDDVEQGFSLSSPDLEIGSYIVGMQFTVPDDVSLDNGDAIGSAVINWVSDRTHSANTTLTFSVENTLDGGGFGSVTGRNYLPEQEVWQASGTWQDGENITVGVDLADQINSLIAQDGLDAGDVITVKVEGAGGTRYVEAAGGGRTAPTLAMTMADSAGADPSINAAAYLPAPGNPAIAASGNREIDPMDISSGSDEVGLLGINDVVETAIL